MKKFFVLLGALCVSGGVFCACYGAAAPEETEPLEPLASLKAEALYTEKPAEEKPFDTSFRDTVPAASETVTPDSTPAEETSAVTAAVTEAETTAVTAAETTAAVLLPEETVKAQTDMPAVTTAPPETVVVTQPVTQPAVPPETTVPITENPEETVPETSTAAESTTAAEPETEPPTETITATEVHPEPAAPEAEELLDFDVLQEVNKDICAWIEIDGTVIDDPILQNPEDDTKYLSYGYDNEKSTAGAIYTEATYNSRDFNDPVTLIYGHRTLKGHMFGALHPTYSDPEGFAEHSDIKIYLPGEVRHYTVFAAVPYDSIHILYTYDFSNTYWYKNFFKQVKKIRAIGANINEDAFPEPGDRVIILSVCIEGNKTQRYLVMAVLGEDLADNVRE